MRSLLRRGPTTRRRVPYLEASRGVAGLLAAWALLASLVLVVYAPLSHWGPFAGPSLLSGCPAADTPAGVLGSSQVPFTAYLRWAAPTPIVGGALMFPLSMFVLAMDSRCHDPKTDVAALLGGAVPVAVGWLFAVFLSLAPC